MKHIAKHLFPVLLLCLSVLLLFTACKDAPTPSNPGTTTADTPASSDAELPDGTEPAESGSADTTPVDTPPADTAPVDTPPAPDGVHIPDPSVNVEYAPKDGVIVRMGIFDGRELGDTVGYAATMMAGGEIGSCEVTHKGKTYTLPAYRKTATEGQSAALDLSAYADDETLRAAITDGYTMELTVQLTETLGDGFHALFSATQNGMFGLAIEDGKFLFQQFDSGSRDYPTVFAEEEAKVGELYHLVGVYSAERQMLRFYINGVEQDTVRAGAFAFGESPFIYVIGADVGYNRVITDYPAPPAVFTGAAIYDAVMEAADVRALYDKTVAELATPVPSARPYNPAAEYYFSDLKLNGEAKAGADVELTATLHNESDSDRIFKLSLTHPLLSVSCDEPAQKITVKAGETAPVTFNLKIRDGGSMLFDLKLLSQSDLTVMAQTLPLVASGKGYYVGDAHTHSTLSDGRDSLADNFGSAHGKGHAFMIATDHNYDITQTGPVSQAAAHYENFLAITANEITTEFGHMLEYGVPHRHDGGHTGHMWEIMAAYRPDAAEWQRLMDEIISEGGLCFPAHPFYFSSTGTWKWPGVGADQTKVFVYQGFTGIEVYNADSYANGSTKGATEKAFEWWDRYNLKGEQRYYGISNTDGHGKEIVSRTGNALLLEEITPETILDALRKGHFYGTNGAEIRFDIDGVSMGDALPLPADGEATLTLRVADQAAPLTKVILYTYTMTGNIEESYQARKVETLFDSAKDGMTHIFELTREIEVQDGQFYRVEVFSASSLYGDFDVMGGFAFTNPIWVGDLIEAKYEDNVTEVERKLTLNKTVFEQGEDILITPVANPKTDTLAVYPVDFVPGKDASIYWTRFEGNPDGSVVIPNGVTVKMTDIPGNNHGNHQVGHMYSQLPVGEYKVVLRDDTGSVVAQVNFTVTAKGQTPEDPVEPDETRRIELDKETYKVGEDIWITAGGTIATDQICIYPLNFVPGQDASIYWARFEGYPGATATVVAGSTFKMTDIPGDNRGNWQVGHMYDPLPAGEYKAVIRGADGSVVLQVNFTVVEP
ncbi:MAG: CehA/McbA family metallohydrolase [Clostridia bacterium]|nr:CehA/McbA family metallohydrolase [Clostridia bacterium]